MLEDESVRKRDLEGDEAAFACFLFAGTVIEQIRSNRFFWFSIGFGSEFFGKRFIHNSTTQKLLIRGQETGESQIFAVLQT